jgi:pimeloyl-ACP methyl ester carboxylesterase
MGRAAVCGMIAALILATASGCGGIRVREKILPRPAVSHARAQRAPQDPSPAAAIGRQAATMDLLRAMTSAWDEFGSGRDVPSAAAAEYNRALEQLLRDACGRGHLDEQGRASLVRDGFALGSGGEGMLDPARFGEFHFASDFIVRGLEHRYGAEGIGVPIFAVRRPTDEELARRTGEERFYPYWEVCPATAVLRFEPGAPPTLVLCDTLVRDRIRVAGATLPLASDLSTPTAYHFAKGQLNRYERVGMFAPQRLGVRAGLHLLHPYERGKIPVVMIHGLASSPKAWGKVVNELRGDPALRARYQFWMFMYPTGNPFNLSAAELRKQLVEVRQVVDPAQADPAFDRMVLVGHSMGGLLARMAVTESGDALWKTLSNRPIEELVATPEDRDLYRRVMFLRPLPFVRRIVFIATPHRGSRIGNQFLGRLGDSLIRLPNELQRLHDTALRQNPPEFFTDEFRNGLPSSIDLLRRGSLLLEALDRLPVGPGVSAHTIVGRLAPVPLEHSTDGVVPYASSHIAWTQSELVVPGNHSCQDDPRTIEEIRRILALHASMPPPSR